MRGWPNTKSLRSGHRRRKVRQPEGYRVFASRGCLLCHTASGPAPAAVRQSLKESFERGDPRFPAPNLTNFGTRTTLAAGILENDPRGANLFKWLRDPRRGQAREPHVGTVFRVH